MTHIDMTKELEPEPEPESLEKEHTPSTRSEVYYKLCRKIGSGSFGKVYLGTSVTAGVATGKEVAIKMEDNSKSHPQIPREANFYKFLRHTEGIPKLKWTGVVDNYNYLVLELLGPTLDNLFISCKRKFSLKTTLMLADQLIDRLESIHNRSIIHRDLKPANLLMGLGSKSNLVHVVDFGLAKRYRSHKSREHMPEKSGKRFLGTARYAPKNSHRGKETSRRDDLEALGYILVYFCKGRLPWQGFKSNKDKMLNKKYSTSNKELCLGLPAEFEAYFNYCASLGFDEDPNYGYLKNLFKTVYKAAKYPYDNVFDWS